MMRCLVLLFVVALLAEPVRAATYSELFPTRKYADAEIQSLIEGFDYKRGSVAVLDGAATLEIGPGYYFLDANDARPILERFWGSPPNPDLVGAIFPIEKTPVDGESWVAEVAFNPMGRVAEEGFDDVDAAILMAQMQQELRDYNPDRQRLGYAASELVGWIDPPIYDAAAKRLRWSTETTIEGQSLNTLNAESRLLGRRGVLAISLTSSAAQRDALQRAATDLATIATFAPGHAHADFDAGADNEAEFNLAELIVGKSLDDLGAKNALSEIMESFWFLAIVLVFGVWWWLFGRKTI